MRKSEILKDLDLGKRVAEEETDHLASYFVETDQWSRIWNGQIDIVYGPKGSGKSAIYSHLLDCGHELVDRNILVESAENPRGAVAFKDLLEGPPLSEEEFKALWKLYIVSLMGKVLRDYSIRNAAAERVISLLKAVGLLPPPRSSLQRLVKTVRDYVSGLRRPEIEGGVRVDPASGLPEMFVKITPREPSQQEREAGALAVDDVWADIEEALEYESLQVWLLFDRLDVTFSESPNLERNALRALFMVYNDLVSYERISLKVFLRSDIWRSLTDRGFREASHITRSVTIDWDDQSLLNLVVKRLVQNEPLLRFLGRSAEEILASLPSQESVFYDVFPQHVSEPTYTTKTFPWLLTRSRDGTGKAAPRELIHLLSCARDEQIRMLELGHDQPPGRQLISEEALKDALPEVSRVRLEQTIYAEYSDLRMHIQALASEEPTQRLAGLARLWRKDMDTARVLASRLVEIGVFKQAGSKDDPEYRVPPLYRPALDMTRAVEMT